MDALWGQVIQAFRDTTIAYSEGHALTMNGKFHGFERPGEEISETAYGDALNQCAYGRRGTNLCMFDTIEGALSDLNWSPPAEFHTHPDYPDEVIDPDGTRIDAQWNCRYIRIGEKVHFVQTVLLGQSRTTDAVYASAAVLKIAQVDGTYTQPLEVSDPNYATKVVFLPFVIRVTQPAALDETFEDWSPGEPCLYEVLLFANSLEPVPPSYLLTEDLDAPSDSATPVDMPFGSQLVEDNDLGHIVDELDVDNGPHPIYLIDGTAFPQLTSQLNRLMCAGCELKILHEPYDY